MAEFRKVHVGDVALYCAIEGTGPLVIMVHGFPESWYSWRHQLAPIAAAGFTACAIDVRGYGGSDKPHAIEDYTLEHLCADLVGLRDALSPGEQVVIVGHDWGAPIVWNSALARPDVFRAVAALSVPFTGVPARSVTDMLREVYSSKGRFFYQEYFQEPGVAEAEAEADPRRFVETVMYALSGDAPAGLHQDKPLGATFLEGMPQPRPVPWLTGTDLAFYAGEFARSGFRGPLNRYRNFERDFAWLQQFRGHRIETPALFIGGERDPATFMFGAVADPVGITRMSVPMVEGHILPGCGHWTQQERPAEVNSLLVEWLKRL